MDISNTDPYIVSLACLISILDKFKGKNIPEEYEEYKDYFLSVIESDERSNEYNECECIPFYELIDYQCYWCEEMND